MSKFKIVVSSIALSIGLLAAPVVMSTGDAYAACTSTSTPKECISDGANKTTSPDGQKNTLTDQLRTIVNLVLFILGAIAVIVIVIGGVRYVVSGGDSSAVKGAKDTILYAVVGLIVALLAYAIVDFVLKQFT